MPKRRLPDGRKVREERMQGLTQRVAVALVLVIILLGLSLFLLG